MKINLPLVVGTAGFACVFFVFSKLSTDESPNIAEEFHYLQGKEQNEERIEEAYELLSFATQKIEVLSGLLLFILAVAFILSVAIVAIPRKRNTEPADRGNG